MKDNFRNIYAHTREECEEKLKVLIVEMKEEIADIKSGKNPDNIPGGKIKKKAIAPTCAPTRKSPIKP